MPLVPPHRYVYIKGTERADTSNLADVLVATRDHGHFDAQITWTGPADALPDAEMNAFVTLASAVIDADECVHVTLGSSLRRRVWPLRDSLSPYVNFDATSESVRLMNEAREFIGRHCPPRTNVQRAPRPKRAPQKVTVVATDASWRRGHKGCGIAFVTEDGHHKVDYLSSLNNIHVAELRAIEMALEHTSGPVKVLTDSQQALLWLQPNRKASLHEPQGLSGALARIGHLRVGRRVEFEKVRSHSGVLLNDAADRLAVAARRGAQLSVPDEQRVKVRENILSAVRAELSVAAS